MGLLERGRPDAQLKRISLGGERDRNPHHRTMTESPDPVSPPILAPGTPEWTRRAEEYRAVVAMIQDTGSHIWVINGAYLVVLGLLAKSFVDESQLPSPKLLLIRGAVGLVLACLWLASFERNYAFYSFRIRLARSLERQLGLDNFERGAQLSDTGFVTIPGQKPIVMPWIGSLGSIQWLTRIMIWLFLLGSALALGVGLCRTLAA